MGEKLGGKSRKKEGGDGKRRKGEKVGQFIHVCAAQTVDNGTEVDGRPTTLLMEQMKCGLTTHWLSHGMAPDSRQALETLKQSFNHSHCSNIPPFYLHREIYVDCTGKKCVSGILEHRSVSCKHTAQDSFGLLFQNFLGLLAASLHIC